MKREPVGLGQESVWDYPRPPILEPSSSRIRIVADDTSIADSNGALRVLETSHPPVYYLPPQDVDTNLLESVSHQSFCEWKGMAGYYDLVLPKRRIANAGWYYANPSKRFADMAGYIAFYPGKMDACFIDDEQAVAQPGDFYGGWITSKIVGPFKGGAGTRGW